MFTPHKYSPLIHAWADGGKIQQKRKDESEWHDRITPNWGSDFDFRLHPDFEFPPMYSFTVPKETKKNETKEFNYADYRYSSLARSLTSIIGVAKSIDDISDALEEGDIKQDADNFMLIRDGMSIIKGSVKISISRLNKLIESILHKTFDEKAKEDLFERIDDFKEKFEE
jgi:hypothetical protein